MLTAQHTIQRCGAWFVLTASPLLNGRHWRYTSGSIKGRLLDWAACSCAHFSGYLYLISRNTLVAVWQVFLYNALKLSCLNSGSNSSPHAGCLLYFYRLFLIFCVSPKSFPLNFSHPALFPHHN
jgi:hypothetical protein